MLPVEIVVWANDAAEKKRAQKKANERHAKKTYFGRAETLPNGSMKLPFLCSRSILSDGDVLEGKSNGNHSNGATDAEIKDKNLRRDRRPVGECFVILPGAAWQAYRKAIFLRIEIEKQVPRLRLLALAAPRMLVSE
jgi:hypothetical protein